MPKPAKDYFDKQLQINFKGMFHFESLYKMIYDWLVSRGWSHWQDPKFKSENIEDFYQETILAGGAAKNHWIWFRAKKEENEMFHYYMDVNFQTLVLGTKEVVYKGEKYKMNDGEINIYFKVYMEIDPKGEWASSKEWTSISEMKKSKAFMSRVAQIYKEKDFIAVIDDKEDDLYFQLMTIYEKTKQFLNLMPAMPLQKPFHPELGYPQL